MNRPRAVRIANCRIWLPRDASDGQWWRGAGFEPQAIRLSGCATKDLAGSIALVDEPHARQSTGLPVRAAGGEGWIRTSVRLRGQIYSLLPLTTRPPLQVRQARHVAGRQRCVNALHLRECRSPLRLLRSLSALQKSNCPRMVGVSPLAALARSNLEPAPGRYEIGAGEGNRTLVVSLEGFCSAIELHPLVTRPMPFAH